MSTEVITSTQEMTSMDSLNGLKMLPDIQAHSTKKTNLTKETRSNNDELTICSNIVFNHCKDIDSLEIYFIVLTPGVERYCIEATADLLISYDHNDKIVSVDIDGVSSLLHWPFMLNPVYNEISDTLNVNLVYPTPSMKCKKTEIDCIEIGIDDTGKIVCLSISNARDNIEKPLSDEERNILAKKSEEYREKLAKWSIRRNNNKSAIDDGYVHW